MRIHLFLGAALLAVLSGSATAQEPTAREPDLVAVPRLIPPRYELMQRPPVDCISGTEKTARLVGGAAAGYVFMPALVLPVLLVAGPFLIRDGGGNQTDDVLDVLRAVGAIGGAIGGFQSIQRQRVLKCPRQPVGSPLVPQR
jgi:hypothetical protein